MDSISDLRRFLAARLSVCAEPFVLSVIISTPYYPCSTTKLQFGRCKNVKIAGVGICRPRLKLAHCNGFADLIDHCRTNLAAYFFTVAGAGAAGEGEAAALLGFAAPA